MRIRVGAVSDVGQVRTNNEDSFVVQPPLYAVADGMGGVQAGEVASSMALDTLKRLRASDGGDALGEWVREANRVVYQRSQEDQATSGMGTTLTALLAEDGQLKLAHVGDTRAYLLRGGKFRRLTEDHSVVHRMVMEGTLTEAQAEVHPDRNILTRALGIKPEIPVDETMVAVRNGDRIMLCSDGLHGMVKEPAMQEILQSTPEPQQAAQRLVDAANANGGVDNVTAVVLDVDGVTSAAAPSGGRTAVEGERRGGGGGRMITGAAIGFVAALILALVLHALSVFPFAKKTTTVTKTKSVTVPQDPVATLLASGAKATAVRYGDLTGHGLRDVAVASAAPSGGPFLDVGGASGKAFGKLLHVDYSQTTSSGGAAGSAGTASVSFLELVNFSGSRDVVVGVTDGATLDLWVYAFRPAEKQIQFNQAFPGGHVYTDGSFVYVESQSSGASGGIKIQRIGKKQDGSIGVLPTAL